MQIIKNYFPTLNSVQHCQLERLISLYLEWNSKINLISKSDVANIEIHHILHSLSLVKVLPLPQSTIFDLGCGGGLPSLPLAIIFPQHKFLAIDSIAKKINLVDYFIKELNLNNINTICQRFEDIKNQKADLVICRAVAPLINLIKWTKKVLDKNNSNSPLKGLICLKGGDLTEELRKAKINPKILPISAIYSEEYFKEKYILY